MFQTKPGSFFRKLEGLIFDYYAEIRALLAGNVGLMALSWFLFSLSGSLVNPFFAKYAKDLGATDLEIAYMRSIGILAFALSLIPGGFLTDYLGRVKVIVIGTGGIVITQFLYALAQDWKQLAIIWVVDQILHFYSPALTAIIMDSLTRGKEFSGFLVLNVASALPGTFMPVVGGLLYEELGVTGVRVGFIASGVISLTVFFIRLKMLKETFRPSDKELSKFILELAGYRPILNKALRVYVFSVLIWPLVYGVLNTYGAIYAIDVLGLSKPEWGIITSFSTMGNIVISLLLVKHRSFRLDTAILFTCVATSFSFILMALPYFIDSNPLIFLFTAFLIQAISSTVINSGISTLLTRILPREVRGRATGIQRMLENLGSSMASMVAGFLYVLTGPGNSFVISAFICTIGCVYLWLFVLRSI
ncbi:MAG: MFS transporter [Desulfurococcaceae archaeon]